MITVKSMSVRDYTLDIEFKNAIYGLFARDKALVQSLLLRMAGLDKSNKTCTYLDCDCYDNESYFKKRIYMDFKKEYFATIQVAKIVRGLKNKYQLEIDGVELAQHFGKLMVRGECEITSKYQLTPTGNSLVNASVALANTRHLIINNPTVNLSKENDISYIFNSLYKKQRTVILGLDNLRKTKGFLEKIIFFTDFNETILFDANDYVYVLENTHHLGFRRLFVSLDNRYLICHGLSKEDLKMCDKHKVKVKKVSLYEIEAYL